MSAHASTAQRLPSHGDGPPEAHARCLIDDQELDPIVIRLGERIEAARREKLADHRNAHLPNRELQHPDLSDPEELLEREVGAEPERNGPRSRSTRSSGSIIACLSASYPTLQSLVTALSYKDRSTAEHSWRVAELLSRFSRYLGRDSEECLVLELAGLLHDVGKIGVPDSVLFKPAKLSRDEAAMMDRHHRITTEIIRPTIPWPAIIEVVDQSHGWFDGSRPGFPQKGEAFCLGARMLAIVDAYDAMTSDRVYRQAMSSEAAFEELTRYAGTQFDPELVQQFRRFLSSETEEEPSSPTLLKGLLDAAGQQPLERFPAPLEFCTTVLDALYDGIGFVTLDGHLVLWNKAAEELTGYSAEDLGHGHWRSLEEFCAALTTEDAQIFFPLREGITQGKGFRERLFVRHKSGEPIAVELHVVPVSAPGSSVIGGALLFRDVRDKVALEKRCRELATRAMQDPLTGMLNRAEFDRRLRDIVNQYSVQNEPCSLVVADLDYFKDINDSFGHQCGDEVLKVFAHLLASRLRPGDLVARYGGEEFVLVFPHCSSEVAWRRAESLRLAIATDPMPVLRGRHVTSSFGITELQPGDSPKSFMRRADRALYLAKQRGRNRSIKIHTGSPVEVSNAPIQPDGNGTIEETFYVCSVQDTVRLKLLGFIADHNAHILFSDDQTTRIRVGRRRLSRWLRPTDENVPVELTLHFRVPRGRNRMAVHTQIRPDVPRRWRPLGHERCVALLMSLRAYLQAE